MPSRKGAFECDAIPLYGIAEVGDKQVSIGITIATYLCGRCDQVHFIINQAALALSFELDTNAVDALVYALTNPQLGPSMEPN